MMWLSRRPVLALPGTLAVAAVTGKSRAEGLPDLARTLVPTNPPAELPDGQFFAADGSQHKVADFRGRGIVLNFWATWCAPCVAEIPALEALSKTVAPADIAVLPLSSDRGGAGVVETWFRDKGITGLPVLLDPKGLMARSWNVRGLPTTVIIDRQGRDRARLEGAADWSTRAAIELISRITDG